MERKLLGVVTVTIMLSLPSCTTFMSNVSGDFQCSAPEGTCAPTLVIDDQALAVITGRTDMVPAGPYLRSPSSSSPLIAAKSSEGLRIIFPAMVDGQGRLNERTAMQIPTSSRVGYSRSDTQIDAAVLQNQTSSLDYQGTKASVGNGSGGQITATPASLTPTFGMPDPAIVQAARDRAEAAKQPTTPEEIKAAVAQKLSRSGQPTEKLMQSGQAKDVSGGGASAPGQSATITAGTIGSPEGDM